MAVTNFSPLLGLALPTTGDLDGTWGTTVNDAITQLLDSAVAGTTTLSVDADVTLSTTNGAANQARNAVILWTASNGATTRNITAPAQSKTYMVLNAGTGSIVLRGAGPTAGVTIVAGEACVVAWAITDFVKVATSVADGVTTLSFGSTGLTPSVSTSGAVTVSGTLAVANGGTNATTVPGARTSLGATTLGSNLFTIANPSAITFPRFNADNTVSSLDAAAFRIAIGAGSGGGDVSGPASATDGNLAAFDGTTGRLIKQAATVTVAQGGTNATTASGARTNLGATTLGGNLFTITNPSAITFPRFNADNTVSALDAASFLTAIGAGSGTGTVSSVSGTGTVNGITLTGTVTSSGSLTLGGTLSGVSLATQVSGTLPVANGGTGNTTIAARSIFVANSANTLTTVTPAAGQSLRINAGNTAWEAYTPAAGGAGTVTSVSGTGTVSGLTLSGTVTSSGSLTLGGTIATLNQNTTGSAATLTTARTLTIGSTGKTFNGSANVAWSLAEIGAGDVTLTGSQTLTNKRINPRVSSAASATTLTPDISSFDQYAFTALAAGLTINAPTGTPVDGNKLIFRILDNGTSRTLTWNATYTAIGVTLPTATTANKMIYVGCIYNAANTRWDVIAVTTQA